MLLDLLKKSYPSAQLCSKPEQCNYFPLVNAVNTVSLKHFGVIAFIDLVCVYML